MEKSQERSNTTPRQIPTLEQWLHFIAIETMEDLEKLEAIASDKALIEAIAELRRLNADEEFKKAVRAREAELREEASSF